MLRHNPVDRRGSKNDSGPSGYFKNGGVGRARIFDQDIDLAISQRPDECTLDAANGLYPVEHHMLGSE